LAVKVAFRQVLDKMVEVFAANLTDPKARQRALALVAMCVGAMVVARAVDDPKLGDRFRDAAREHLADDYRLERTMMQRTANIYVLSVP
jgi:TetR/AcrR family transcriptional regulator, transcriptional repressor for nem operon